MSWIKLHLANGNKQTFIKTENITSVKENRLKGHENKTIVSFIGNDNNYINVNESLEEVMNAIWQSES